MTEPIKFPKNFKKTVNEDDDVVKTVEDVDNHMFAVRSYHMDEAVTFIADTIFQNLAIAGFNIDVDNPKSIKDIAMLLESLKSLMMRHYEMTHPIQHIAEIMFEPDDEGTMMMKAPKNDNL